MNSYNQGATGTGVTVNWKMAVYALLLAAALTMGLRYLDKRHIPLKNPTDDVLPIGGWLTILSISLVLSGLFQLVSCFSNSYFSNSVWISLKEAGGTPLQLLLVAELTFSMFWLSGIIALLYWLVNRRDIFPRMFLWYAGTLVAGHIVLTVLYNAISLPSSFGSLKMDAVTTLIRNLVYAAVWSIYILRSERVRNTFLREK